MINYNGDSTPKHTNYHINQNILDKIGVFL